MRDSVLYPENLPNVLYVPTQEEVARAIQYRKIYEDGLTVGPNGVSSESSIQHYFDSLGVINSEWYAKIYVTVYQEQIGNQLDISGEILAF